MQQCKWMPWELGFVDGNTDRCAIVPVTKDNLIMNSFNRFEYLKLYPFIQRSRIINTDVYKLWVYDDENSYIIFDSWLTGSNPTTR